MDSTALKGAKELLLRCLSLKQGDTFALFWDGTTRPVAEVIKRAAAALEIELQERYIPVREQIAIKDQLKPSDYAAMSNALAILTCLSANLRSMPYRRELVKVGPDFGNHFGHMPGVTLSILSQAFNVDYKAAAARCDDLALAFACARSVELTTYEYSANDEPLSECKLRLHLDQTRFPISSTGIIPRGTWGNIPGGEVFVAPAESSAEGTFVLNGAFKGYVFNPETALHLIFEGGRLTSVRGHGHSKHVFDALLSHARAKGGKTFNQLAELGVGVNTGISSLTGNSLFDEKCAGTAHIAIGDNKRYGGMNESNIHEDLVTRGPTIALDGKNILYMGQDAFKTEEWRESLFQKVAERKSRPSTAYFVKSSNVHADRSDGGPLRVQREVAAGRRTSYTVGDSVSSPVLGDIYFLLPGRFKDLASSAKRRFGISEAVVYRAIEILERHGLIEDHSAL
jgi:leucyl aminopeptidase (aminopeptidase T)